MTCLAMTAGTTLCISLALYPTAQLLFRLFSSDDAVVAQGVQMMHYLVPVYMTYICIEIFSGALRGCGDVRVAHHHHSVCGVHYAYCVAGGGAAVQA